MKVVFNTKKPLAAASMFYMAGIGRLENVTCNDFVNYEKYDVALFMTYDEDLLELESAKKTYPNLVIGLVDPRGSQIDKIVNNIDFFVVDSIEMKDFFAKYRIPIHTYYEYPNIPLVVKKHDNHNPIIIGYHGNKVHLTALFPKVSTALEMLAKDHDIEFWAMYNAKELGVWNIGVPKGVKVRHVQWSMENYVDLLAQVDIGIVPACMPISNHKKILKRSKVDSFFLDTDDDYLIKFKMPSNPGRLIVFAKLGVPVVADFLPSNIQFIQDGVNGLLAYSTNGWYTALKRLVQSSALRQEYADNMLTTYKKYFDYDKQNKLFEQFITSMHKQAKMVRETAIEDNGSFKEKLKFNNARIYSYLKRRVIRK